MPSRRDPGKLRALHRRLRPVIEARLAAFRRAGRGADEDLFAELCFCLLAVQANAHRADEALRTLRDTGLLWEGPPEALAPRLRSVRFLHTKARWIVAARETFRPDGTWTLREALDRHADAAAARRWLVATVRGFGYKEASHFLRNVGRGETLAILDRHVLRGLARYGVIPRVPAGLTPRRYEATEAKAARFADRLGVPLAHLDLLLWHEATGEVFK